jgi:endo-1,4-beta-mannosidase
LRRESFHADLARNKKGKILLRFLRSLESRGVRLVDRAWQRAIGECVIAETGDKAEVIQFKSFVEQFESNARLREWLQPLEHSLRECSLPRARQRVLQYGVVVHALIDTLDPKHLTTTERPAYPNKLSEQAKRDLASRLRFWCLSAGCRKQNEICGSKKTRPQQLRDTSPRRPS